jgi:plastocyanin
MFDSSVMRARLFQAAGVGLLALVLWGTPSAVGATVEVTAAGLVWEPANVKINVGDSVHWTGLLGGFHTVAEVDDDTATVWNGGFHSAALATDFTHTFTTAGVYYYICEPHVDFGMRGSVTVNEPVPALTGLGMVTMAFLLAGAAGVAFARYRGIIPRSRF